MKAHVLLWMPRTGRLNVTAMRLRLLFIQCSLPLLVSSHHQPLDHLLTQPPRH